MTLTKGQIEDFFVSPVWDEILTRVIKELEIADSAIERPEPFEHGRAVGMRWAYRRMLEYEKALRQEAEGASPYGNSPKKQSA